MEYSTSGHNNLHRGARLFNVSFLIFQLVFSGFLLFYVLRKTESGAALFNSLLN